MSGIVLSASVRQNLLSLQSTADLLATTQNRLSTGKSVNSALDNPTNFFTAQSLDNRASDINNLLDGIANGVQVLQAANTGLTSLQKLIDSAKSIANQALQTTVGYSTKSNVSTTIAGATAADLRGTTSFASATASSNVLYNGTAGGTTAANGTSTLGATIGVFASTGATAGDGTTALGGTMTLIATNGTTATGLAGNAQPADGGDQGHGAGQRRGAVAGRCARAGEDADGGAERGRAGRRGGAAGRTAIHDVAVRRRAGVGGCATQVGRRRTGDGGGDVGLGGIADRGLQRLVGDRLRRVDQLLQRGDAGVGSLQHLHAVGDAVEQVVDVAGAVVERLGREEVGGIVQGRVDALAGRQTALGGGEKIGGGLEGEQVLTNRCGENDTGH